LLNPSSLEYWHMGETTTRFGKVSPANWIAENKLERCVDKQRLAESMITSLMRRDPERCSAENGVYRSNALFGEHARVGSRT